MNFEISPTLQTGLPTGLIIAYYATENNAILEINQLPNSFGNTTAFQQTIYARIINDPDCYGMTPIVLIIIYVFNPLLFQDETLYSCSGNPVNLIVANGYSSYNWSTSAITNSITVSGTGNYSVTVTNSNGCSKTKNFVVLDSERATINSIEINDFDSINSLIQLYFSGNGIYEFSLDGNQYQDSATFTNVPPNIYTVHVRDKNGC